MRLSGPLLIAATVLERGRHRPLPGFVLHVAEHDTLALTRRTLALLARIASNHRRESALRLRVLLLFVVIALDSVRRLPLTR
jgi:hypothetical protein